MLDFNEILLSVHAYTESDSSITEIHDWLTS